jgi:type II secretory pathway component PulK
MNRTHAPRGMASVVAVAVIGLVAMTVAMLLTFRTNDFKRLAHERDSAQSEQLMLALIATAHTQLASGAPANGPIALPEGLGEASIEWNDTTATLSINGSESTVAFEKNADGWSVRAQ